MENTITAVFGVRKRERERERERERMRERERTFQLSNTMELEMLTNFSNSLIVQGFFNLNLYLNIVCINACYEMFKKVENEK